MLDDYTRPPAGGEGDNLNASDVTDRALVVQPLKIVPEVPTKYGVKDAISVNVADISDGQVYRSVLWFNGAIVDALRENIGKTLAVKLVYATSKGGNNYLTVEPVSDAEKQQAAAWLSANPTAFAPPVADPTPAQQPQAAQTPAPAAAQPQGDSDIVQVRKLIDAGLNDGQIAAAIASVSVEAVAAIRAAA